MTDRFALAYARDALMARIKDASVEAVKAATDIVALVEGVHAPAQVGQPVHRPLPVSPGADAELRRLARPRHLQVLRLRRGRRRDRVRREEGEPRLRRRDRVARRPVRRAARVRGDLARAGPRAKAARAALPAARPRGRPSTSGTCGSRRAVRSRATTSRRAASARRFAASSGSGSRRAARRSRARRGEQGFTGDELSGAGLANRRGNDYFTRRLLFPLADARGRVRGFQARQLYEDDPLRAKYVNSPGGRPLPQGRPPVRPRPRPRPRSPSRIAQ